MAAVTGPGYGYPPPVRDGRRRRWAGGALVAWGLVLTAAVFWSVRNDPPTVPEQRDAGQALPALRAAAGAVVEAAQEERWVLRLGELRADECSLTPVRDGVEISRDVTLYVAEGEAREALDSVTAGLPPAYGASVVATRGGTRLSFYADAGEFIAIETMANSADRVLDLHVSTGCRPESAGVDLSDPAAGPVPAELTTMVAAMKATGSGADGGSGSGESFRSAAVPCPSGGTAVVYVADGVSGDASGVPVGVPDGTTPVWSEPGEWAYRNGSESVVVTAENARQRATVTTGCRAG